MQGPNDAHESDPAFVVNENNRVLWGGAEVRGLAAVTTHSLNHLRPGLLHHLVRPFFPYLDTAR